MILKIGSGRNKSAQTSVGLTKQQKEKTMRLLKYRADKYYCIDGKQVKRSTTVWAGSDLVAKEKFRAMLKADKGIQEAVIVHHKSGRVVDDYVGYI